LPFETKHRHSGSFPSLKLLGCPELNQLQEIPEAEKQETPISEKSKETAKPEAEIAPQ
jgi:hypothetical protein